jgi:F-type H+-transporting ATPase subunit delta
MSSELFKRYAMAFIDLAEESKALEKVEKDVAALYAMIKSSDDLRILLSSPQLSKATQMGAVNALAKKAKFQKLTQNFLGTLIQNGRLDVLLGIIEAFYAEMAKRRGEKTAIVNVVQDLTLKQKKDLQNALSKIAGGAVALDVRVTPEILGGMVVTLGSTMIDDSTARKLERLKLGMAHNIAA